MWCAPFPSHLSVFIRTSIIWRHCSLMHHNPGAELFTPPSYCSLTAIGMELTAKEKLSVNKQKIPKNISFERIMEAITPELELRYYEEMLRFELVTDVVSLRATLQKDEKLWKEAELSTENLLHDFCCDIFAAFAMEDTREYVLSIPDDNGFPMEYAPAASKRAINKTDGLTNWVICPYISAMYGH